MQRWMQPFEIALQRPQVPVGHHAQRPGDMTRVAEQGSITARHLIGNARAGLAQHALDRFSGQRMQRHQGGKHRQRGQHFRRLTEHGRGGAAERQQRAVDADQGAGRALALQAQRGGHGGAGRVPDDHLGLHLQLPEQGRHRARHTRQRTLRGRTQLRKPLAGKVRRQQPAARAQASGQGRPGMAGGAGTVQE